MHQIYDIEMAKALVADRRAQLRRAATPDRRSSRRLRLGLRGRAGPGSQA
jgi:hypothetical protein